jgi:hypothetical protein
MKGQYLKFFFGFAIFLFALALSYFTADYLKSNNLLDYWGALALFAGIYVLLGIIVSMVFPISLGFLFSADILIINILLQYYGQWADLLKCLLVGAILLALYAATWIKLKDKVAVAPDTVVNTPV